jgi:hypothetical protein
LWDDSLHYRYLPRRKDRPVLAQAIAEAFADEPAG